jgi:cytochrome c556
MERRRLSLAVVIATALIPASLAAHEGAVGIAKERMDAMQGMADAMKQIDRYIAANRNHAAIGDNAENVGKIAEKIPQLFPTGSGTGVTNAKPAVWERRGEFEAKARDLAQAASTLQRIAASGDPIAIYAQYQTVGHICAGCHEEFREKR